MNELGTLTHDGDHATITFRRHLHHPIEAVWTAITDPEQRAAWFGTTMLEPHAGGAIEMMPADPPAPPDAKRMTGRVLVWAPPARRPDGVPAPLSAVFEHEWHQRIVEDGVVRYELTEAGDGTELTFTHRGLAPRSAQGFVPGTHAFLDRLAAHLGGSALPAWQERYDQLAPEYPAWA